MSWIAKLSAGLGIASWGNALAAAAVLSAIAASGGFFFGQYVQRGQDALASLPQLRSDAAALAQAGEALRKRTVEHADQFRSSALMLEALRITYEDTADAIAEQFTVQQGELAHYLSQRPDLAGCVLDADGVRVWNAAARMGSGAAGITASADQSEPAPAVSADASGADRAGSDSADAGGVATGRDAVPAVRAPAGDAGRGLDGV